MKNQESCQEIQEKQETPRILPRNPGKCKKCQESRQEFQEKSQQK